MVAAEHVCMYERSIPVRACLCDPSFRVMLLIVFSLFISLAVMWSRGLGARALRMNSTIVLGQV